MHTHDKIYVAGHRGMVGSAIVRLLDKNGFDNIITHTHSELDLTQQHAVDKFFLHEKPEYVFLAAAKVGGIMANSTYKADFIYENLVIASNIIHSAWKHKVKKLLNLGSSCIYPKNAPQPIKEECLLDGYLESTNEPYAIAKIAAIKLCRYFNEQYNTNFISAMPCNLYGIGDNFHLEHSHVLPAMIRKFHEARQYNKNVVCLWGDGSAEREFLYVDDLAEGLVFLMNTIDAQDVIEHINIGFGFDISIKSLANIVKTVIGYQGDILWDNSKPNGTPKKLMDSSKINKLGWRAKTQLENGIEHSYSWFQKYYNSVRK